VPRRKRSYTSLRIAWCTVVVLGLSALAARPPLAPPRAKQVVTVSTIHGEQHLDAYAWLRQRSDPDVMAYLEAENLYATAMMRRTETLQKRLYEEMLGRIRETDTSVPVKIGEFYYYVRTERGKQYAIHCRKQGSLDAPEEVILDENTLAAGQQYFELGVMQVSPDHRYLAYAVDTTGDELYTLMIKDLHTGILLPDTIPGIWPEVEWANDNQTIFYTVLDAAKRPHRLFRHRIGTDPQHDVLLYHEPDEAFRLRLSKTRSKAYLLLQVRSLTTSEMHLLPADRPLEAWQVLHPRQADMRYDIEHQGEQFYILTDEQAANFKLMSVAVAAPGKANWREVLPHRQAVKLEGFAAFERHLVLYERHNGLQDIRILNTRTGTAHTVAFAEPVYALWRGQNEEFHTQQLRFDYSSLVTPKTVYEYDMDTGERRALKQEEVRGYDATRYHSERLFVPTSDGVRVPLSVVYKRGMVRNGKHPLLLEGYGAYGANMRATFSAERLSLLDRGMIYAIAHVRGGGELGKAWHDAGRLRHKKNTFSDFIAVAEFLIAHRYTRPEKLVIRGESAGGLLMGAVASMRPELLQGIIARVPFVDVINTMLDPTIPLVVIEYDEWGNPADKAVYDYMKTYSPYDNVAARSYPHLLITAGLNDPRVPYWEPAKWVAKLRAHKTDSRMLLLRTNLGAGHGGASGRYDALQELAFEHAFILEVVGLKE
jgi:oligopeptidase B